MYSSYSNYIDENQTKLNELNRLKQKFSEIIEKNRFMLPLYTENKNQDLDDIFSSVNYTLFNKSQASAAKDYNCIISYGEIKLLLDRISYILPHEKKGGKYNKSIKNKK